MQRRVHSEGGPAARKTLGRYARPERRLSRGLRLSRGRPAADIRRVTNHGAICPPACLEEAHSDFWLRALRHAAMGGPYQLSAREPGTVQVTPRPAAAPVGQAGASPSRKTGSPQEGSSKTRSGGLGVSPTSDIFGPQPWE